jgi:hypothetical protein
MSQNRFNIGLNILLVPTFYEIDKKGFYILQNVKKVPKFFPLSRIVHSICFFSSQLTECLFGI